MYAVLSSGDEVPFCCGSGTTTTEGTTVAEDAPETDLIDSNLDVCIREWNVGTVNSEALGMLQYLELPTSARVLAYGDPGVPRIRKPLGAQQGSCIVILDLPKGQVDAILMRPSDLLPSAGTESDSFTLTTVLDGAIGPDPANVTIAKGGSMRPLEDGGQSSTAPEGTAFERPLTEDGAGGSFACPDPPDGVVIDLRSNALPCPDAFKVSDEFIKDHDGVVGSGGSGTTGPLPSGFTCQEGLLEDSPPPQRVPVTCAGEGGSTVSFGVVTVAD